MMQYGAPASNQSAIQTVPVMAGFLVIGALAFIVFSSILFKGSVHF